MPFTKTTRPIQARAASSYDGLAQGWRREGAIRTHVGSSAAGLLFLAATEASVGWVIASAALMLAGLSFELVNAAVEALLDRLHPGHDPEIGAAKDMCSAAALLINIAATATVAGGFLFSR